MGKDPDLTALKEAATRDIAMMNDTPPAPDPDLPDKVEAVAEEVVEEVATEEVVEEAAPAEEVDEVSALRGTIDELLAKKVEEEAKPPEVKLEPIDVSKDEDFIGDTPLDELLESKDKLNALMNKVYKSGRDHGARISKEEILKSIPDVVRNNVIVMSNIRSMADKFYQANPDLEPYKQSVASISMTLSAKNPDWEVDKLLTEVAGETRKRLGMVVAAKASTIPSPKPKFAKAPATGATKKKGAGGELTGLAKDLADMVSAAEG